jgi:hypothetical protein
MAVKTKTKSLTRTYLPNLQHAFASAVAALAGSEHTQLEAFPVEPDIHDHWLLDSYLPGFQQCQLVLGSGSFTNSINNTRVCFFPLEVYRVASLQFLLKSPVHCSIINFFVFKTRVFSKLLPASQKYVGNGLLIAGFGIGSSMNCCY